MQKTRKPKTDAKKVPAMYLSMNIVIMISTPIPICLLKNKWDFEPSGPLFWVVALEVLLLSVQETVGNVVVVVILVLGFVIGIYRGLLGRDIIGDGEFQEIEVGKVWCVGRG